jgi:hypothetical protein
MGFFNNLFGSSTKKTISAVITNTQDNIFKIYRVRNPSDALKMKASVYLCISGIASINEVQIKNHKWSASVMKMIIDKIVNDSRKLTEPLSTKVSDLANNEEDLKLILSFFPIAIGKNDKLNGLAAFEALYLSKVEPLMESMHERRGDSVGLIRYSALVVQDGIFGADQSSEHFMEMCMEMGKFHLKLAEAI